MKAKYALILLAIYLFSSTELGQLMKAPFLVAHYLEHKNTDSEITFFGFLKLHYMENHLENHPVNDDLEHDLQLPFMGHNISVSASIILPKPIDFKVELQTKFIYRDHELLRNYLFIDSIYLSTIWQPPKNC